MRFVRAPHIGGPVLLHGDVEVLMTPGQVVAIIGILANVYLSGSPLMSCLVKHESEYRTTAVNGIHKGAPQFNPNTFEWFGKMALEDPFFLHAPYLSEHFTYEDPLASLLVMAWAIQNGYEAHWSTLYLCEEVR